MPPPNQHYNARTNLRGTLSYGGNSDPFAELIAEARYANGFVSEIHDELLLHTSASGMATGSVSGINLALRDAGFAATGEDLSLGEDQARLDEIEREAQRAEIATELDGLLDPILENGVDPYSTSQDLGVAIDCYVTSLEDADPEYRAIAGEVLVEYGVDIQAGLATPSITTGSTEPVSYKHADRS